MLIKNPKPEYRRWIKKTAIVLFVAEAAAFTASYFLWSKVNTDRGESSSRMFANKFVVSMRNLFQFQLLSIHLLRLSTRYTTLFAG